MPHSGAPPRRDVGLILGALKLTYGLGQFVNGQLSQRMPSRVLLAAGMLGERMWDAKKSSAAQRELRPPLIQRASHAPESADEKPPGALGWS